MVSRFLIFFFQIDLRKKKEKIGTYVHICLCVYMYMYICNRLPWQLGFTPTISRGVGGAMVLIINQTGSANPLQVSCTKVSKLRVDLEELRYNVYRAN